MDRDTIIKIEIDELGRLHIQPRSKRFTMVYRSATEVHWDIERHTLYSPKPSECSYLDWYNHIIKVIKEESSCELYLTEETNWVNISENIKDQIKVQ